MPSKSKIIVNNKKRTFEETTLATFLYSIDEGLLE